MNPDTVTVAAISAGATIGVIVAVVGLRALRRAITRDASVTLIGAAVVALAAGTLTISFVSLWHLTGTPWLGLFVDLAIVVLMALQLVGYRSLSLTVAQWVILGVSMWANSQAHQPPEGASGSVVVAVSALGACQPLILKLALVGFKHLLAKYVGQEIVVERVPLPHWLHDPRGAYWITRQLALKRIASYEAACRIEATVTRRALRARQGLSARQQALLDVLDEEAERQTRKPSTPKTPRTPSADTRAGAAPTTQHAPAPSAKDTPAVPAASLKDIVEDAREVRDTAAAEGRRLSVRYMEASLKAKGHRLGKDKAASLIRTVEAETEDDIPVLRRVGEAAQ